jgi:hypothetical protein
MDGIGLDHGEVGDGCKPSRIPDEPVGAASAAMLFKGIATEVAPTG